jgi:hypothetical protein
MLKPKLVEHLQSNTQKQMNEQPTSQIPEAQTREK